MSQQEAITIRPTKKQREAKRILDQNTILVYGGGIRSGKSFFLLLTILTYCFQYDKSRWLICRESLPTLKRNLFPTFQQILNMGFQQYVQEWNQSTQTVTFTNGSQIIFMAESFNEDKELNRFRGLEINGAGIDEINEIQKQTFYKIIERSGSWTGAGKVPIKIIGTCNPSHTWVKELFYDAHRENRMKPGWAFVNATITDNPFIEKEYLDSLKANMPAYEYEVFVRGNWDMKLEGILFDRSELKRFSLKTLKQDEAEATLAYADIADEGDDYLAMPISKVFDRKVFVTDAVFTQENGDVTIPICVSRLQGAGFDFVRVESNNQGSMFVKMLRNKLPVDKILKVSNTTNKHTRILMAYAFIKEYFYFLDESEIVPGSEYDLFMRQVFSYMKDGSSKHDDAPDALSGLAKFCQSFLPHLFK